MLAALPGSTPIAEVVEAGVAGQAHFHFHMPSALLLAELKYLLGGEYNTQYQKTIPSSHSSTSYRKTNNGRPPNPTPRLPGRSNPPHHPPTQQPPNKPSQLLNQMYASLSYIQTRHPYGEIPGQPSQAPQPQHTTPINPAAPHSALPNGHGQYAQQPDPPTTPPPEDAQTFDAALRELARDLVLKEQQIEVIINSLPGLGNSEAEQVERMRELETELREVEAERARAEAEREGLVEGLGGVLVGVGRVV